MQEQVMQRSYEEEFEGKTERRPLGGLIADLTRQLTTLVRKEIELARVEMTQKASTMARDAIIMGFGGALLYAGFLALLAAAVIGFAYFIPLWLSALIVSAAVLCVGAIFFFIGKARLQKNDITPTQTIISLEENKEWIKRRT
jgi:uncharacterized membrane protein YqjE